MVNRVWHRFRVGVCEREKELRHEPCEPHAHKFSDLIKKSVGINQRQQQQGLIEKWARSNRNKMELYYMEASNTFYIIPHIYKSKQLVID
jgi:hypothetical protein